MTAPAKGASFDARPLSEPVDPEAVRAFARELRARGAGAASSSAVIGTIIGVVVALIVVPVFVTTLLSLTFSSGQGVSIAALGLAVCAGIGILIAVLALVGWRRRRIARYRLDRFARANGMTYEAKISAPPLPGMIFGLGRSRMSTDVIRGTRPRFVEFGNYQYTVKTGKSSTTYTWGYVAVKLDVPLPNIVLDARGNNSFGSNLPASFRKAQRLSLEGDFDAYFELYCPEGYERDALYLFTPDIMARFIDNAAQLDVEIVDDWLFLYTQRKVATLDPATWAWLFGTVGALITKFDQWARWRDERLLAENPGLTASAASMTDAGALPFAAPAGMLTPPPGVAREGRRLKRSFRWVTFVIALIVGIVWIALRSIGAMR